MKQSCWAHCWPAVDIYRSFLGSWWASASRCDSESCPPHTLHTCPPACRSRPPCRSRRAARGEEQRRVSQISLTSTQTEMTPLGKWCHQNTPQANWLSAWWWRMVETHPHKNPPKKNQTKKKWEGSQNTEQLVCNNKKLQCYVRGEHWDEIMSVRVCVEQRWDLFTDCSSNICIAPSKDAFYTIKTHSKVKGGAGIGSERTAESPTAGGTCLLQNDGHSAGVQNYMGCWGGFVLCGGRWESGCTCLKLSVLLVVIVLLLLLLMMMMSLSHWGKWKSELVWLLKWLNKGTFKTNEG